MVITNDFGNARIGHYVGVVVMKNFVVFSAILMTGAAMAQSPAPGTQPFEGLDHDGNGRLSPTEAATSSQLFVGADKDGNGTLDRYEYAQYLRAAANPDTPAAAPATPATPATPVPRDANPTMQRSSSSSTSSSSVPPLGPTPGTEIPTGTPPPAHGSTPEPTAGERAAPGTSSLPPPPPGAPPVPRP